MTTLLQKAIDLAQEGQRKAAEEQLRQVLVEQPDNEVAWIWLSAVARDIQVKQEALKRVLVVNPNNQLAQKGLARFGRGLAETRAPAPPSIDEPPAIVPAIDVEAPPEAPVFDFDFDAGDADIVAAQPEAPIFDGFDLGEPSSTDFDFDFDDFDFDAAPPKPDPKVERPVEPQPPSSSLFAFTPKEEPPPVPDKAKAVDAQEDIDWGLPSDFFAESEAERPPSVPAIADADEGLLDDIFAETGPSMDSKSLEEMLARTEPPAKEADEEAEQAILPEPVGIFGATEEEPEKEKLSEEEKYILARQRQQKQSRLMIIGTVIFALSVIMCSGLYYYLAKAADIYTMIPQLAGAELSLDAPKPKKGVSVLKFRGYPASRARVEWTADPAAETCAGSTGLSVDFMNGDPPSRFNNRVCSAGACTFEKEITSGPISKVTVSYICAKDAVITLYK